MSYLRFWSAIGIWTEPAAGTRALRCGAHFSQNILQFCSFTLGCFWNLHVASLHWNCEASLLLKQHQERWEFDWFQCSTALSRKPLIRFVLHSRFSIGGLWCWCPFYTPHSCFLPERRTWHWPISNTDSTGLDKNEFDHGIKKSWNWRSCLSPPCRWRGNVRS